MIASCHSPFVLALALAAAILLFPGPSLAQPCGPQWLPGHGIPGVNQSGAIVMSASTMWDPDGPGPEGEWLVVAGVFEFAGTVPAASIARWNPATGEWAPLGGGINGDVRALAVLPSGELIAGGVFSVGTLRSRYIARFDGTAWHPLGAGLVSDFNDHVLCLAVLPNGDLIAGGRFSLVGNRLVNRIARWDGEAWHALGTGLSDTGSNPIVFALSVLPGGDLLAAGRFRVGDSRGIARWNGATWSGFGSGLRSGPSASANVTALHAFPDGSIVAGGDFDHAGGLSISCIARWENGVWSGLGSGIVNTGGQGIPVRALSVLPSGDLIAAGRFFTAGGITVNHIARWDGEAWHGVGGGLVTGFGSEPVRTLTLLPSGDLVAGGSMIMAGDALVASLARWNGQSWSALSSGTNRAISALLPLPRGGLVAGGSFDVIAGASASRIAQFDGRTWSAIGSGVAPPPGASAGTGSVSSLALLPSGDIVAGGSFSFAGDLPVRCLAGWNGSDWYPFGAGLGPTSGLVAAIAPDPENGFTIGGSFSEAGGVTAGNIARWDGVAWHALGSGVSNPVRALAYLPNGQLIAGGDFSSAGGLSASRIARWAGGRWSGLGSGMTTPLNYFTSVLALLVLPGGDLIAAGKFDLAGGIPARSIARWNGSTWSALGPGLSFQSGAATVHGLALHPSGDIIAVGNMSAPFFGIARWNGSSWSPLDSALAGNSAVTVNTVVITDAGEIVVGGNFFLAGPHGSAYLARWTDTGAPWAALHPQPATAAPGDNAVLQAAPASAYSNVSYHWHRNNQPITDGPAGASPNGGTVSGASGLLPSPTDGTGVTLTITNVQPSDAGDYTIVFTNACGEAVSQPATLIVTGSACPADWNNDTLVNSSDISSYLAVWLADMHNGTTVADFNADNQVNSNDISAFLTAWLAAVTSGC